MYSASLNLSLRFDFDSEQQAEEFIEEVRANITESELYNNLVSFATPNTGPDPVNAALYVYATEDKNVVWSIRQDDKETVED